MNYEYKIFLLDTFRLILLLTFSLFILISYNNEQTESIKTKLFVLTTAIEENSCFHLELPRSDDDTNQKRIQSSIKTTTGRNRTDNRKAKDISKSKPRLPIKE